MNKEPVTNMEKCTIYYESWQLQCCGKPFAVGDYVDWDCVKSKQNAHGIPIDFVENHHGFATYSITGNVTKIIAERSESPKECSKSPKGRRIIRYSEIMPIYEELQHADGRESEFEDDATTYRTFWGYIVELKDVVVKPLKRCGTIS